MKFISRIIYTLILTALLASCAVMNRGFHANTSKSDYTARQLADSLRPAGPLEDITTICSVPGPTSRRMLVYLPENYYKDSLERFPVLYIIHGARGNETSWIIDGKLMETTDSLMKAGLLDPFIVVMPNMNSYKDDADFGKSRFKKPIEAIFETDGAVESAFMKDVVAVIDSAYRTIPDKEHRALAGLSVGALQAIFISASNPDSFDAIGLFSPMHKGPVKKGPYSDFYSKRAQKQDIQFANPPRLYSIYIGRHDIFYHDVEHFRLDLNHSAYPFQYHETTGGHGWDCWRQFYGMFIMESFGKRNSPGN